MISLIDIPQYRCVTMESSKYGAQLIPITICCLKECQLSCANKSKETVYDTRCNKLKPMLVIVSPLSGKES